MNIHYINLYWSYLKGNTTCLSMLKDEIKYKNTLVLDGFELVIFLCLDFRDDDYYYVCKERRKDKYLSSGVGRLVYLKDKLDKKEYDELVRVWNLNYEDKAH
jgi:hypothetical protein